MLLDLPTAARYNAWANNRVYNACGLLTDSERKEDRRAFFKSIHRTLNHVLLADLLYRQRLENQPVTFTFLDEVLYEDFEELEAAHRSQDEWYVSFSQELAPSDLDGTMSFDTVETGEHFSLPLRTCLTNLFQHQIHHRGQIHHMISHAGHNPPPVDVVKFGSGETDGWTVKSNGVS